MKRIILILISLSICGCVSMVVPKYTETRFSTDIKLSTFNSVLSQFVTRPTFAKFTDFENPELTDAIYIQADGFGGSYNSMIGYTKNTLSLEINKLTANYMVNAIDKYLKWEVKAAEKRDLLSKLILITPAVERSNMKYQWEISFYSGNETNHYMLFKMCMLSSVIGKTCGIDIYIDKVNVLKLKSLINNYMNNKLDLSNRSESYN